MSKKQETIKIQIGRDLHKALMKFGDKSETFDQIIRRVFLANPEFKAIFDKITGESI